MNKDFQSIDIVSYVKELLTLYPFCEAYKRYSIDVEEIAIQKFESNQPQTSIDYVGSQITRKISDIWGNTTITRQANFIVYFLRKSNINRYREDINNFFFNMERLLDNLQIIGELPKFSENPDTETMWFTDGMLLTDFENEQSKQELSVYSIQLHLQYDESLKGCNCK